MDRLKKITNCLILLFLFVLPFQTRWIYKYGILNGQPWEYGTLSWHGTEILLWLIIILTAVRLFGRFKFWQSARWLIVREYFKTHWKNLLLALFFLAGIILLVRTNNPISWQFLVWFLGGLCLIASIAVSGLSFSGVAMALWLSGIIQGLLAIYQFFCQEVIGSKWLGMATQNSSDSGVSVVQFGGERWLRAYGSFSWPNSLGIYLAIIFILGLILYFYHYTKKTSSVEGEKNDLVGAGVYYSRPRYRLVLLLGQLVILTGLLLSFSRGAWLAVIGGIVIFFIITVRNYRYDLSVSAMKPLDKNLQKFLKQFCYQLLVYGVLIVGLIIIYQPVFIARFNINNYLENLSITERQDQMKIVGEVMRKNSLIGVGVGLYTDYLSKNYPRPLYGQYQPAHNIYFLMAAEMGLLGFLFLAIIYFCLIRIIGRRMPIYFAVLAVLIIAGFYDHWLWSLYSGQMVWWAVFALGFAKKISTTRILTNSSSVV